MNCSRLETLLTDYLDETLDQRVQEAVSVHVSECSDCADLLQQVMALRDELSQFPELEPAEALVDRILVRTSGKPEERSWWNDLILPTVSPFLTQRYAFATVILFGFLSLMVNVWGPGFSALSASDLRPSAIVEESHRFSNELYRKWMQVKEFRSWFFEEIRLLQEDLYSRIDYYLISILFESYSESLEEQQGQGTQAPPEEQDGRQ